MNPIGGCIKGMGIERDVYEVGPSCCDWGARQVKPNLSCLNFLFKASHVSPTPIASVVNAP